MNGPTVDLVQSDDGPMVVYGPFPNDEVAQRFMQLVTHSLKINIVLAENSGLMDKLVDSMDEKERETMIAAYEACGEEKH